MEGAKLRVLKIVDGTIVDGPGLRTSIYFAGCSHHCEGCHNPQSWDAAGGTPMSVSEIMAVIDDNEMDVTFTGGDPLMQIEALLPLAQTVKEHGYNLWVYTGYTIEEIQASESLRRVLDYADTVVDGQFVQGLRDISLRFRGSSNQRIIDVKSLKSY